MKRSVCSLLTLSVALLGSCSSVPGAQAQSRGGSADMERLGIPVCPIPDIAPAATRPKPPGTVWWAPKAPAFPYPANSQDKAKLEDYAGCLSDALTRYIDAWAGGAALATLPDALIPWGTDRARFKTFTLRDPDAMPSDAFWVVRDAHQIDPDALWADFSDPNATYLVVPSLLAPFGSTLSIDGDFPHARFFSAQVTPPFDLNAYHYNGGIGVGEVPIVDADIRPEPGSTNPFLPGADRTTTRRAYRLQFDMAKGDPVALNPAFRPPDFRASGNRRMASGLGFQGPWGHPKTQGGHGRGLFEPGQVWLRYYAPDLDKGARGGVALPRLSLTTPRGSRFFIEADTSGFEAEVQKQSSIGRDGYEKPGPNKMNTDDFGWVKQAGIFESIVGGIAISTKAPGPDYVNDLVRGVAGRGDGLPAPADYEQSATSATHIDYLVRGMALERDHVAVLTGRMPTFPNTRRGNPRMQPAQMRYWSITGYHVPQGWDFVKAMLGGVPIGLTSQSIMDDEVVLDANRDYTIVFSRDDERPRNAVAGNGVTWVDWGASAEVSWTLRWLSVGPEWKAPFAPTPQNLGDRADMWSRDFNPDATWRANDHRGALGRYQPKVQYMSREAFEALAPD